MAARTRSRDSRTAASGRPTIDRPGSPGDRSTSTVTGSACRPFWARLWTVARPMDTGAGEQAPRLLGPGQFLFQRLQAFFQAAELGLGAGQQFRLGVETLAADQFQAVKVRAQHGAEVVFQ